MKALELNILNRLAPYEVVLRDGEYYFHTDFNIEYSVEFKYEPAFGGSPAYWFDLMNRSGKASPNDPKVRETVIRASFFSSKAKWWSTRAWRISSPSLCRVAIPTWTTS